jgi:hypothetical protein
VCSSVSGYIMYRYEVSKIKLKKFNKKRTVTVRGVSVSFEYLKASIADLITLLSSSIQNSEGGGNGNSGESFADPLQEFNQGFLGSSSGLPPVNHFLGLVLIYQRVI